MVAMKGGGALTFGTKLASGCDDTGMGGCFDSTVDEYVMVGGAMREHCSRVLATASVPMFASAVIVYSALGTRLVRRVNRRCYIRKLHDKHGNNRRDILCR